MFIMNFNNKFIIKVIFINFKTGKNVSIGYVLVGTSYRTYVAYVFIFNLY